MISPSLRDFVDRFLDALSHHRRGRAAEPSPPATGLGQRVARALGRLPAEPPDIAVSAPPEKGTRAGDLAPIPSSEIQFLSADLPSLAHGVPDSKPGTLYALSRAGGVIVSPREGNAILFGRDRTEVHVRIGEDDPGVNRRHGILTHQLNTWWLSNIGRLPLRLPGSQLLVRNGEPQPLTEGYTPLFVTGSNGRLHLLELFVAGPGGPPPTRAEVSTRTSPWWQLADEERLVLVVLGQHYLLGEADPRPLTWQEAADHLARLRPDTGWTPRRVEARASAVRKRLAEAGVPGLTLSEVGEPPTREVLLRNLIEELLESKTLVPPDLTALDA